jgi:hypothetical protein
MHLRGYPGKNRSLGCLLCNASMGYWVLSYLFLTMSTILSAAERFSLHIGVGSQFERPCNSSSFCLFSQMLLNSSLQRPLIRTHDLSNLLAVLEEQEGRHGPDAQLHRYIVHFVDVDLEELGLRVLFAELGDLGRNDLARPTPGGEAIEDDERRGIGAEDVGLVGGLAVER